MTETATNPWDADWQPYDDDTDPFAGDWEATTPGTESLWQADWQPEVEEAPTFGGRVKESWETGKKQVSIGQMSLKQLFGDKTPETEQRIQAIEETILQGPRPSRGLPEQAVRAAAEMAPIPLTGMEQGLKRGTALGLGFGAIATLGGPAAPITVPAAGMAGFSIGMISASLENIGGIEAGLAYREFKDLKDPETGEKMNEGVAKIAGLGVGVINGAIELLQIKTFLRSIPGAEMLVRKGLTESVKKVLKSKALKSIVFQAAKKYGTGVAVETGQEELQEIVNISGRYMATEVNNALKGTNIPTQTKKEIVDQLLETGKQSALAFSVFMAPGTAVSSTKDMVDRKKAAGPGEADLLKTDKEAKGQEAELREAFNTGQINSTDLKEIQSQLPKKHPSHKVIKDLLKQSEATIPEKDMMTGEVLALEPEDFLPDEAIPTQEMSPPQMYEAAPQQEQLLTPQEAIPGAFQPLAEIPAEESAQVFEGAGLYQDKARADQIEIERRAEVERVSRETSDRTTRPGYEGLTQQVKEKSEASEIEGMEFRVPYIRGLLEQVKGAEAGKRVRVQDYDGTEKWFGVPSEFPAFMKNRYSKKEVVSAIEKGLSGYVFPESEVKQASIWEDVKSEAYQMRNRDLKLAAETFIEEPTTIKDLPDKEYKLLITELQHEGYSTREIEEIAARHRKTIESDVIASIGNEYGFSKEEIEQILSDPLEAVSDLDAAWKEATGTKPVAAYLTPVTEVEGYAQEKERRLARSEQKGKEPGRAIQQGRGGKEAEAGGVFQEASPDEIEQKGLLIAKLINGNLFPGHKVKYDGIWEGFAPDMPDMYQFTAYAGPAKGATFISKELEADSVKEKLEDTVEKFSKAPPPVKEFKEAIDKAADEAETEPTDAQKEAGNYKKGHINLYGLDITIENPKGSIRKGVGRDGKPWETKLKHHYGYILRTEDKDGDQVDVFIGDAISSDKVFVVNQIDPGTKNFDEHKTMMGFETEQQARVAYLANYERGWKGLGNIVSLSVDQFKTWLKEADQTKPISKAGIKGHRLPFMAEHRSKAELDRLYQGQVKVLTERAGPDKDKRSEMLAEVLSAYKIELKKYPAEKGPVEKVPAPKALKEVLKNPSATEAEVTREKAHLKAMVIEGVKSGKYKGAVRFSTVIDLKKTVEKDKLYVSREGVIHATPILGPDDDAFPAYGSYKNHAVAYIIPKEYITDKPDAHTKEVLIDPDTPLDAVTFLVDGQDRPFHIVELISALDARPTPKQVIEDYTAEHGESEALEFYKDIKGGTGRFKWNGAVIHRSTIDPDGWRITYFDAEGFSGHSEFKTIEEAVSEAIDAGFETPEPGLLDRSAAEPGFLEGTVKTYKIQKEWAAKRAEQEKELWEMTKADQLENVGRPVREHRDAILAAHKAGKTIPTEVLDDFPEISKRLGFKKKEKAEGKAWYLNSDDKPIYTTEKDAILSGWRGPYSKNEASELTGTHESYFKTDGKPVYGPESEAKREPSKPWGLTQEEYLEGDARKRRREEVLSAADSAAGAIWGGLKTMGFLKEGEYLEDALKRKAEQESEFFTDPARRGNKKSGTGLQEMSDKAWSEQFSSKQAAEEFRKAVLVYIRGHKATWLEKGETFESPNILTPVKHEALVKDALDKGERVPDKVLIKYPELEIQHLVKQLAEHGKEHGESDDLIDLVAGEKYTYKTRQLVKSIGFILDERPDLSKHIPPELDKFFEDIGGVSREPLVLTPEKGTPWERQAELEREGAVERPAKGKKVKGEFGVKAVTGAGAVGRQQGLFGYEKGETTDMFAEAEEKAKAEPTVADLIAEITADIMPTNNLKRGLDHYASRYENFSIEQLKELREWTKTQNPYVDRRLGGNIQTEIMFQEAKSEPVLENPQDYRDMIWGTNKELRDLRAQKKKSKEVSQRIKTLEANVEHWRDALAKLEKKEAKVFVKTLDQVRADAKKGKKAAIDYTAQMEVAETGDIVEVTTDAGAALNEADNRLENYNKLLECIESD